MFAFQAIQLETKTERYTEGDPERDSIQSIEGSVADSKRGPSKEGGEGRHRYIPLPPPPTRGSYWLLQQRSNRKLDGNSRTVQFHGLNSTAEELDEMVVQTSGAFGDLVSKTLLQSSELLARQHSCAFEHIDKLNSVHTTYDVGDNVVTETKRLFLQSESLRSKS